MFLISLLSNIWNYFFTKTDLSVDQAYIVLNDGVESTPRNCDETICTGKNVDDSWNVSENKYLNRTIISKIINKDCRILTLSTGNLKLNLDDISTEFLPIIGDWIELDVKCEVDEDVENLLGSIIKTNRILPVRQHIKIGKITKWDLKTETGVIDNNTYFTKNFLSSGYLPNIGDRVVTEVIESDQDNCSWRALKLIPEYLVKNCSNSALKIEVENYIYDHPDINIEDVHLEFKKLGEKQLFTLLVNNNSKNNYVIRNISFKNADSQCKLLGEIQDVTIQANGTKEFNCECVAKKIGKFTELILFDINNFELAKWIKTNVCLPTKSTYNYKSKDKRLHHTSRENDIIRGQRINAPPRFISSKLPDYNVPSYLMNLVRKHNGITKEFTEEFRVKKPCCFSNLTYLNFEDKFHNLLFLDEIEYLIAMQTYNSDQVSFIPNDDYLMLEVDNLSERRPSIIVGDRIIASSLSVDNSVFEGIVHKIGAKHVYLKFARFFHESYKGDDYSIRVVGSRTTYKRQHNAVHLAVRNLGSDLLFPTKMSVKPPQIFFTHGSKCAETIKSNIIPTKGATKLKPHEVLKKIDEHKRKNTLNETIEWHNKDLNIFQKDAIRNILLGIARPLPYVIFGPPGTGKTVTVIETILQIIQFVPNARLLVCAPSNSATDLIAIKLIESGVLKPGDLIRFVAFSYVSSSSLPPKLVPYCCVGNCARTGTELYSTQNVMEGISEINNAAIGRHRITIATCSSAGMFYNMCFPQGHFSHIIVDEAGQTSEPELMIPLSFLDVQSGQIILAGDPEQLGPVVLSNLASDCGLRESYLERILNRFPYIKDADSFPDTDGFDPRLVTKLKYNYRSLSTLLELTSTTFYDSNLIPTISNTNSVEIKLLRSVREALPEMNDKEVPCIVFHGVDGENYQSDDSPSWFNPHEAAQVFFYINEFIRLGAFPKQIGVITPYIKQVKEIRNLLREAEFDVPKIGTVEEFQGQEFDIVLISTVRSSDSLVKTDVGHSLGFICSPKRINVAISRAKVLLVIIGNPYILIKDVYWRSIINYCIVRGAYTGCDLNC